jgi:hypothetical protein
MRLFFTLLLLLSCFSSFGDNDLYPYVGMPLICRFDDGRFEGKITALTPQPISTNHSYTFQTSHVVRLDHRIRLRRIAQSDSARQIKNFDRNFVRENCQSARRDTGLIIRLFGRGGFSEGDSVDCDGIRSVIEELRMNDVLLLEDEYLFHQEQCSKLEDIEQEDPSIDNGPRETSTNTEEAGSGNRNSSGSLAQ